MKDPAGCTRGPPGDRPANGRAPRDSFSPILVNKYNGHRTVYKGAGRLPFGARADPWKVPGVMLKWGALSFKLSELKKTHIWRSFNVLIYLDDALLFQNKENKIFLAPPPPKKRLKDTNGICLQAQVFVYTINPWPGYSLGRDWAVWVIRTTK